MSPPALVGTSLWVSWISMIVRAGADCMEQQYVDALVDEAI